MVTTVVFDLDDTLYDEIAYCRSAFAAAAKAMASEDTLPSEQTIFETLWREFSAGNRTNTFNAALDKLGIPYSAYIIGKLVNVYRLHKPAIALPDSSKAVLDALYNKYTLALLTDGFLPAQELKVESLGIKHYFKFIVYTEVLGRQFWKPSPVGYQHILAALDVKAETCVYVGDNETKDFIAPNQLGFTSVKIVRPNGIHRESGAGSDAAAAYTITDLAELPKLLESL